MTRDDFFQKLEEVSADIENVPLNALGRDSPAQPAAAGR
jgi:hypothetical protein